MHTHTNTLTYGLDPEDLTGVARACSKPEGSRPAMAMAMASHRKSVPRSSDPPKTQPSQQRTTK